ncbi:hypothetical protein V1478_005975 [Vespula squamosa]|uniref:Uncharacterized protein n=1 Tax=Vespula squamosa TaxID=30214 RepID=A0ABD2B8Y6_VESSQ
MLSHKHTISHPAVAIPVVIEARGTAVETAIAGGKANIDRIIRNLRLIAIERQWTRVYPSRRSIVFQESPPILKTSIAINLKNEDNNVYS